MSSKVGFEGRLRICLFGRIGRRGVSRDKLAGESRVSVVFLFFSLEHHLAGRQQSSNGSVETRVGIRLIRKQVGVDAELLLLPPTV